MSMAATLRKAEGYKYVQKNTRLLLMLSFEVEAGVDVVVEEEKSDRSFKERRLVCRYVTRNSFIVRHCGTIPN